MYNEKANLDNRLALYTVNFRDPMPDLFSTMATGVSKDFDPDPTSLFNVMTMHELCKLGASVPNILIETNEALNKTFTLQDEWNHLAKRLGLPDDRHLYFLWLWMEQIF